MQEEFFLVSVFDKLVFSMTSCYAVEEEIGEDDDRHGNSPDRGRQDLGYFKSHTSALKLGVNL